MPKPPDHVARVGKLDAALRRIGLEPILVGAMALVVLGSRRVTRDFDFVVAAPGDRFPELVDVLYDHGLELVSRLSSDGDVTATIATRAVASARLRIDRPETAYFYDPRNGLRIDLLFDLPVPAATLAERATRVRIGAHVLHVAGERDLLELKKIAAANRKAPGDVEDLAFLQRRLRG